jgi:hypothetical protein
MAQITGGVHRGHAAGDNDIEKAASQLVSDTKYKVKQRLGDNVNKMAPAALIKAYMEQLSKSPPGPVRNLAQKKLTGGGMKEDHNIGALASSSVANALFKVFVEGVEKEQPVLGEEYLEELMKKNKDGEPLYSVKVYYKNGTTYTRWSSREDMSRIRSNPNVESIEMVDYVPPQDQQGSRSSKKDYDGDGKVESGAKEYRGSVHNAIQRKNGGSPDGRDTSSVKEDLDFFEENKKKDQKFDIMPKGEDNTKIVKLFPETNKVNEEVVSETAVSTAKQKFMEMVHAYKKGEMKNASSEVKKTAGEMSGTEAKKFASTKHKGLPKHVQKEETACDSSKPERDMRGDYAKTNLIKNKLRSALGVKNPIVMVSDDQNVKEGLGLSVGISKIAGQLNANPRTSAEQGAKNFQKNVTDPIGKVVKGAARAVLQPANNSPEAKKAREGKYRPEEVELEGEMIDERRREDKGTPRKPRDKAFELVAKSMGTNRLGVKPRGEKKDRTSPVEAAPPEITPAHKVAKNRASRERGNEFMRDTRGT